MNQKTTLIVLFLGLGSLFSCKKSEMPMSAIPTNMGASPDMKNLNICTTDMQLLKKDGMSTSAVGNTAAFWPNNPDGPTVITVKFMSGGGGSSFVRSKIKTFAKVWESYANVHFEFVDSNQYAQVRITNMAGRGSWSYIGVQSLGLPYNQATMNFDSFTDATPDTEFYRVVVHQFGHALGLEEEKNHPLVSLKWNKPYIYNYYMVMYGWSNAQVDQFFFNTFPVSESSYSGYDKASLMHFPIPAAFTLDGVSIWNTVLSATDKFFIQTKYPFPTTTPTEIQLDVVTGYTGYLGARLTTSALDVKKTVSGDIVLYSTLPGYQLDPYRYDQYVIVDLFGHWYKFDSHDVFNARTETGLKGSIQIFKNGVRIY